MQPESPPPGLTRKNWVRGQGLPLIRKEEGAHASTLGGGAPQGHPQPRSGELRPWVRRPVPHLLELDGFRD